MQKLYIIFLWLLISTNLLAQTEPTSNIFKAAFEYKDPASWGPGNFIIHDMDGDGLKDIIATGMVSKYDVSTLMSVRVLKNEGGNKFTEKFTYELNAVGSVAGLQIEDINNDKSPDIVVLTPFNHLKTSGNLYIFYRTDNNYVFERYDLRGSAFKVEDINNDGAKEIIVARNESSRDTGKVNISLLQFNKEGEYSIKSFGITIPVKYTRNIFRQIHLIDVNKDELKDLIALNRYNDRTGSITLLLNTGTTGFLHKTTYELNVGSEALSFDIFEVKGRICIAVANLNLTILEFNQETFSFDLITSLEPNYESGLYHLNLFVDDLDLDGKPDIVSWNSRGFHIFNQDVNNNWIVRESHEIPYALTSNERIRLIPVDLNFDNASDIAVVSRIQNSYKFYINQSKSVETSSIKYFKLFQSFPNPCSKKATILFELYEAGTTVSVQIYSLLGKQVAQSIRRIYFEPGLQSISIDLSFLPSGIYIYRLKVGQQIESRKMIVVKGYGH